MAILNAENATQNPSRPPPKPPQKPALFIHTLIPKGAVSRTISCSMLPPHALSRTSTSRHSPPALWSCRQLVVSTDTSIQVLAVHDDTLSLTPLTHLQLFTRIYDIAAISSPVPGRDVLVVLADSSTISFMQFDDRASRLRCSGEVTVLPPVPFLSEGNIRHCARLLATHPRKRMVAVASLQSVISVFPVLFLPKHVNAGKIATVAVDGIILSIDFLEDEEGLPGDAILVALLQRDKKQVIALYTVGVPPDSGGGLSVTFVGSMITCASHPDDVAVARATSKLTGETVRPTPPAVAVTRIPGCPFLFAVFVRGKIIAGDARSVIIKALSGESMPMSVRIEDDIILPKHTPRVDELTQVGRDHVMRNLLDENHLPDEDMDASHHTPELPAIAGPSNVEASGVLSPSSSAGGSEFNTPQNQDGFVTPTQPPSISTHSEPPPVEMPSRRSRLGGLKDIPPMSSHARRSSSTIPMYTGQGDRNVGEDYLSYLFVPAYITLDVGDEHGVVTAWVDARDHFRDENGDGSGLYFVMESGAMFALKWSDSVEKGTLTFRIPGGDRTRTTPKKNFSVEFIGDVGPAVSIASLDRRLLYVANDSADGSLRQLHLPVSGNNQHGHGNLHASLKRPGGRSEARRYGLEVRQEFLNLSPISDFFVNPPPFRRDTSIRESGSGNYSLMQGSKEDVGSSGEPSASVSMSALSASDSSLVLRHHNDTSSEQSAFDYMLYGGNKEAEIIACSGIGRYGSIRLIRPGAPVTILASTESVFTACNNMWPIRFTMDSMYDAGIVLTFAQETALLLSVPVTGNEQIETMNTREPAMIAKLINGTLACGLLSCQRSIEVGLLEDGVIAQIHAEGIRLIGLTEAGDANLLESILDGSLVEPIYERIMDWAPPGNGIISMGTIGAGFILICVIEEGDIKPILYLLKCYPGNTRRGLVIVSSCTLEHELSCMHIPKWTTVPSDDDISSPRLPPMAILGSYAPSVEVRLLGPTMEVLDRKVTCPWNLSVSEDASVNIQQKRADERREFVEGRRGRTKTSLGETEQAETELYRTKTDIMTGVPESLCALEVDERRMVFAGLRDGSVICFSFDEVDGSEIMDSGSPSASGHLFIDSHRKLGHVPVVLKPIMASIGQVVLGQAERPWMCTCLGGGRVTWTPLAFSETRAACSFSVYGAERCFVAVADDDAMYICALRRRSSVSVRSIHIGATPRRALAVSNRTDIIVVATSNGPNRCTKQRAQSKSESARSFDDLLLLSQHSELRAYNKKQRTLVGSSALFPGELVHVLINWLGFIIVGTSWAVEGTGLQRKCRSGRLLLYSLRTPDRAGASSSASMGRMKFSACSQVVLPGAVLAGAPHPTADIFVASCNEDVIVFAVPKSHTALVEIARVTARNMVVSISVCDDIVCVVDKKDSVSFFQLYTSSGKLIRNRSDHKRRTVSDAVQVDRTLAVAVDRLGGIFSIGYEDNDAPPKTVIQWPDGSVISPYLNKSSESRPQPQEESINSLEANQGDGMLESSGLGQEYDVMPQESGSEHTADSAEQGTHQGGGTAEESAEISVEMSESDQMMSTEDDVPGNGSGEDNSGDNDNNDNVEAENIQGGNTDEANAGQSVDDGVLLIIPAAEINAEILENNDNEGAGQEIDFRRNGVPRNLVCHHSYNMKDTALRIRIGSFSRSEKMNEVEWEDEGGGVKTAPKGNVLSDTRCAMFCGTLGGAIIAAVPMSGEAYELLSEVENELSIHYDIGGPALGSSHKKFRAAYGSSASSCVDGDLLRQFCELSFAARSEIAERVGCDGEKGVMRIEGVINDLCDRVG